MTEMGPNYKICAVKHQILSPTKVCLEIFQISFSTYTHTDGSAFFLRLMVANVSVKSYDDLKTVR